MSLTIATTEKTNKDNCPACGYGIDTHSASDDPAFRSPGPHDVSICLKCGAHNKFDKDLKLVPFTQEDRERAEPSLLAEMDAITGRIHKFNEEQKQKLN